MGYFTDHSSVTVVKARFRELVLIHHPDRGGDSDVMKLINAEYPKALEIARGNEARAARRNDPAGDRHAAQDWARSGYGTRPGADDPYARSRGPEWASREPGGDWGRDTSAEGFRDRWRNRTKPHDTEAAREKGRKLYAIHKSAIESLASLWPDLHFEFLGDWLIVAGKTYQAREDLKMWGFMWCPLWRRWFLRGLDPIKLHQAYDIAVMDFGRIAVSISRKDGDSGSARRARYEWDDSE